MRHPTTPLLHACALALAGLAMSGAHAASTAPGAAAAPVVAATSYHLEKRVVIPGGDSGWDYNALDSARGRLYIAHRDDGLHVYDVRKGVLLTTLPQSAGVNTAALAPEFDLGIAGTTDGHVLLFRPSTLKVLERYQSSTSGFDGAAFDAGTRQFVMVGGADERKGSTPILFFDARSGKQLGSVAVDSAKVDAPRVDGHGNVLFPLRDKSLVLKVAIAQRKVAARYALAGCVHPAALEIDVAGERVFVGCRGDAAIAPALAVLEAGSGRQLATLPIGRGVDEVMYDPGAHLVVTANGSDANMTVIRQDGPDAYQLDATVGTFPMARTGVLDERTGKIYLVNAQYSIRYVDGKAQETAFTPNTFSVMTYAR